MSEVPGESRPRIVHVISGDLWAGAEAATFHLVQALRSRDEFDLRVVTLNEGVLCERLREIGIDVEVHCEARLGFGALVRRLRESVADADLVHAHRYKEDLLAALSRRPWLATHHGRPEPERGVAALRGAAYQAVDLIAKRISARAVVAVSEEVAGWLAPRVGRAKVCLISNGISDPACDLALPEWNDRPMRLGVLGRLYPVKGIDLAIEAVANAPGWELEIVGDGPERTALEALIERLGVRDRVRLVGHVDAPLSLVAQWRALLVPSLHEGHPISVIEAMALGTPVVSGPLPGVEAMLDGRGGWMLPDRDAASWMRLLRSDDEFLNQGEGKALGARAVYEVHLSADSTAARMAQLYRELLRGLRSASAA